MVKSLTIGLVDDGVATWNPVSDGNLLVTGGAGCGKTWWLLDFLDCISSISIESTLDVSYRLC